MSKFKYEDLLNITKFIQKKVPYTPDVLIIFGSGLGAVADAIQDPICLEYKDIPNFPVSTVEGHKGRLVFGTLSNVKTVCMQGRFHYYEGYSLEECTAPVRVMALLGVKTLFISNCAGSINPSYKTGDIMFLIDHINFLGFAGENPLRGPNEPKFGPRFPATNRAYDKCILNKAKKIAQKMGLTPHVHEGVYAMVGGPTYETIAEVRALRKLDVDAVGMSTVPEVLVAKHCGMKVFGFSLISNVCVDSYTDRREPNHEEVLQAVKTREVDLKHLIVELVEWVGTDLKKISNGCRKS